jgi:membrane-associated phospholipid phosphatase
VRVVQQLGTPWVLPGTAVVAALAGRRRLAVAAALALPVEKACEVGLKKVRPTPRPLYVEPTVLRDDAPVDGGSFPSGHAAIAFTAVGLVSPHLRPGATTGLCAGAAGAALVRISQGAHHPIDALAGAALGLAIAGGLNFLVGRDLTGRRSPRP